MCVATVSGLFMPAIANVVPIRRAMSSTLRDAIDLYHQTFTDVTVVITRLEKLGLSLWQVSYVYAHVGLTLLLR